MFNYLFLFISLAVNFLVLADEPKKNKGSLSESINSYPIESISPVTHSFADIVEPLIPAVVNIYTFEYSKHNSEANNSSEEKTPIARVNEFLAQFKIPLNLEEVYVTPKAIPLGSGFIIDPSGFIVTNYHVVDNVDKINVKLTDNTELKAILVGADKKTDLALLKVEAKEPLPYVKFGDSANARIGDWIIAIGNPFGSLGGTVTTGIISSKGRDIEIDTNNMVDNFIQTDAAINNGNSGGPMFNLEQEVIGINTAIFSPMGMNIGIGFAIPSNTAKPIIERLKKDGKVNRGRLGVIIQELTQEISEGLGLKEVEGVLVVKVQEGSPGDQAGIKSGDVIIEFAGVEVKNKRKLQVLVAETPVEQDIKIIVIRQGVPQELFGKLIEEKEPPKEIENEPGLEKNNLDSITKNNITFSNLTPELRKYFSINDNIQGIIITHISDDQKELNLQIGDIIIAINQQNISNISELEQFYEKAKSENKQNIIVLVERGDTQIFIPLPI